MYKRILLEHLNNCRDLGGYSCAKGEMIGYQRLYRSEAPDHLEDWEWDIIEKMGVKTIIDLRSEDEQRFASYTVPHFIERISYPLQQYEKPAAAGSLNEEEFAKAATLMQESCPNSQGVASASSGSRIMASGRAVATNPVPAIWFFDWDDEDTRQDGLADHVDIVERVENSTVYTVEGNSSDIQISRKVVPYAPSNLC